MEALVFFVALNLLACIKITIKNDIITKIKYVAYYILMLNM